MADLALSLSKLIARAREKAAMLCQNFEPSEPISVVSCLYSGFAGPGLASPYRVSLYGQGCFIHIVEECLIKCVFMSIITNDISFLSIALSTKECFFCTKTHLDHC